MMQRRIKALKYYIRQFNITCLKLLSFLLGMGLLECPICKKRVNYFLPYGTKKLRLNAECPCCRAAERERIEYLWFDQNKDFINSAKILHFAPEKSLFNYLFCNMKEAYYYPVDIENNSNLVKYKVDIQNIQYNNNEFDLIICNHVLEHVPNYNKGISELSRVLKWGGVAIITVPLDLNNRTLEEEWIDTPKLKIKYYGEANHLRMFGNDFMDILNNNGLTGTMIYAKDISKSCDLKKYGLKKTEFFWLCKKTE